MSILNLGNRGITFDADGHVVIKGEPQEDTPPPVASPPLMSTDDAKSPVVDTPATSEET